MYCKFLQGSKMQGIVVGGNIRCLLKLAGTEYWPDMNGKILLLESFIIISDSIFWKTQEIQGVLRKMGNEKSQNFNDFTVEKDLEL